MTPEEEAAIDWSLCTWEGARRAQQRAFVALSFREKLEAVEEMCDLARHFEEQRRQRGLPYTSISTGERALEPALRSVARTAPKQPPLAASSSQAD